MPYSDPEKAKEYAEKYRKDHREEKRLYLEEYNKTHGKEKKEWYQNNRERELARCALRVNGCREANFNGHLKRKYGLSRADYDKMLEDQKGLCAICHRPPSGKTKRGEAVRLDVDHDHTTKRVRGLVCHCCNCMLGYARDQVETLEAAILYLKRVQDE